MKKSEKRWEQNEVIRSCTEKLKTKAKVKHTLEFVNLAKSLKRMKVLWHLIGCERLLFFVWEMLTEANNPFKESFYGKRKKKKRINILTTFFISYKNGVEILLKWIVNHYPKGTNWHNIFCFTSFLFLFLPCKVRIRL